MLNSRSVFVAAMSCLVSFTALAQTPPAPPSGSPPAAPAIAPSPTAGAAFAPPPVAGAPGTPPAAAASAPVTHAELPAMVKQIILDNPEILKEASQKLRDKQAQQSAQQAKDAITKNMAQLTSADSPTVGDPKADVTIVEFFDYHCGYCKQVMPEIAQLLKEDKKLRVIFKEFPILSEDSVTAARSALAVNRIAKDKYFAYHQELMKVNEKFEEKSLMEIAKKLGINTTKLKAEMDKGDITATLDANRTLAGEIGIHGTPALIINGMLYPGALPYDDLKKLVDAAHAGTPIPPPAN